MAKKETPQTSKPTPSPAICDYSGQTLCKNCKGPLYECDPAKNKECAKTHCKRLAQLGSCTRTTKKEYAIIPAKAICPAGRQPAAKRGHREVLKSAT